MKWLFLFMALATWPGMALSQDRSHRWQLIVQDADGNVTLTPSLTKEDCDQRSAQTVGATIVVCRDPAAPHNPPQRPQQ